MLYFGGCVVSEQSLALSISVMMCKRAHQWFSGCHVDKEGGVVLIGGDEDDDIATRWWQSLSTLSEIV